MLKRCEKLKSCEVTDGCMVQVTSRMRGGGKHKDKKSKVEKKQAASGKTLEQKFVEEIRTDVSLETQEKDEDKMIHLLDEDSMSSWVEFWSKESDDEVGQNMENWMSVLQGLKGVDHERAGIWKCGMRWVVEARRKERGGEQDQVQWRRDEQQQKERQQNIEQEQGKQGKHVRFRSRRTTRGDESGQHRRARGNGQIG